MSNVKIINHFLYKQIMAIKHKKYNAYGLQFHPESIDTEHGMAMLDRFLKH